MRKFLPSLEDAAALPNFVFLGGTVNGSTWRSQLIPKLKVTYFDPVVPEWTAELRDREEQAKAAAKVIVYVITPKQSGSYAFVEMAVTAILNRQKKVALMFLDEDDTWKWDNHQADSITAIENLLETTSGAFIAYTLDELADFINSCGEDELASSEAKSL